MPITNPWATSDRIDAGPAVPAWALSAVASAAGAVWGLTLLTNGASPAVWILPVVVVIGAVFPTSYVAIGGVGVGVFFMLMQPPTLIGALVAVWAAHTISVATALSVTVPRNATIAVRALSATVVRYFIVELLALPSTAVAVMFATDVREQGADWLAPVAGATALAIAVLLIVVRRPSKPS